MKLWTVNKMESRFGMGDGEEDGKVGGWDYSDIGCGEWRQ